jgi:hypothetical protein
MIAEFLDEFYQARDKLGQAASLHDEPPPTGNTQVDALLAASNCSPRVGDGLFG